MRVHPAGGDVLFNGYFFFSSSKKVMPIVKLTDYETRRAKTRTNNAPIKLGQNTKNKDNAFTYPSFMHCIGAVVMQRSDVAFLLNPYNMLYS